MDFSESLADKLEKSVANLCSLHRKTQALDTWKRVTPEKAKPNEDAQ